KSRYSYFTVLRQMHERKKHRELEKKLYLMKLKYQDSMGRLRTERNMELHAMNMEFHDDPRDKQGPPIETMNCNLDDLNRGYEHVCLALHHVFNYLNKERIYEHAAR